MDVFFIDGELFRDAKDALVPALDAGLTHGVGLFETMLALDGRVLFLEEHLRRLRASADALGLAGVPGEEELAGAVRGAIAAAGPGRLRVRLTVTGGDLASPRGEAGAPRVIVHAQEAAAPAGAAGGVRVGVADLRVNPLDPLAGHKALGYWARLRELRRCASLGLGEALVFQVSNFLAGSCVGNVFVVRDGVLLTPIARGEEEPGSLPSPVLPGVARAWVLACAQGQGIEVRRRMLTIDDVLGADEVFLTNSLWGVLPVLGIEKHAVGVGVAGRVARGLAERWPGRWGNTASGLTDRVSRP